MRLHLRHEVHGDDHDDEQGRAAKLKRDVERHDHELRQQTDHGHVKRAKHGQAGDHVVNVAGRLLAWTDPGHVGALPLEVVRHVLRIEHDRGVEEAEENDARCKHQDVKRLPWREHESDLLKPVHPRAVPEPLGHGGRGQQKARSKDGGNHARHVDLQRQVAALALEHATTLLPLGVVDGDPALAALDEDDETDDGHR